jgi:hypothetical protein
MILNRLRYEYAKMKKKDVLTKVFLKKENKLLQNEMNGKNVDLDKVIFHDENELSIKRIQINTLKYFYLRNHIKLDESIDLQKKTTASNKYFVRNNKIIINS